MKKVIYFLSSAMLVAAMTVACNNNAAPEEDTTAPEAIEANETESVEAQAVNSDVNADKSAMLAAAKEAGQAKCNCYKKDAASVESCIRAILQQSYAAYMDDEEFKAAMDAEYKSCIKDKAEAAVKDAGDKAIKAGANAIANKLNEKK